MPREVPTEHQLTERKPKHVDALAEVLVDVSFDGWSKTLSDKIVGTLDHKVWGAIFKGRTHGDCKLLARCARAILNGRKAIHDAIGDIAAGVAQTAGADEFAQAVAGQLGKRITLALPRIQVSVIRSGPG